MNNTIRIQNTNTCASCGGIGHSRRTYRFCPNNPLNQENPRGTTAWTSPDANFQNVFNNASTNNIAAPINNAVPMDINDHPTTSIETSTRTRCVCGSTTHSRRTHRECRLNQSSEYNIARQSDARPARHDLGRMNVRCSHCLSVMWMEEKSSGSRSNPSFTLCCNQGKYMAPPLYDTPAYIKQLLQGNDLTSNDFKKYIRAYNNAFSFTSLGVNLDTSVQQGGSYCFRIHGALYHKIGSVLPEPNHPPRSSQVYIYDRSLENQLNVRNSHVSGLNRNTLAMRQDLLYTLPNPYVNLFINMKQYIDMNPNSVHDMTFIIRAEHTPDARRYNPPTNANEIAALIIGNEGEQQGVRDVVLRPLNGGNLMIINEKHRSYDSLGYPLLFPRGEDGWNISYLSVDGDELTARQLYNYRLMYRNDRNSLHLFGNLFHQFIVDMYAKIEQDRLGYISLNQGSLRAEQYRGLMDAVTWSESDLRTIGRRVILPSTFIGSPRHMAQLYQDAISIVSRFGKPDLFITFTCNPSWPEIQSSLLYEQEAGDRPDLCVRVFQLKLNSLMDDLLKKHILGKVIAHIRVIEFQKRGLPHAHILLILEAQDKPRTTADYDDIVSAKIPDPQQNLLAYSTVINNMMHGPCGVHNPNARCMKNGRCSKHYPRVFTDVTYTESNGYPVYRRRDDGRYISKNSVRLDNRWVVPHNVYLCRKYDAHINVEVCTTISAVKYLYKYVYKGHDRARMVLQAENQTINNNEPGVQANEVKMFLDARYVSAPEACWRIFGFSLHREYPSHERLAVHLPDQEMVYYNENSNLREIIDTAQDRRTTLQGWFEYNRQYPEARNYLYIEFPEHYVWNKPDRKWHTRVRGFTVIGRMYLVSPRENERYFLRLLLLHVRGAISFEDLRTINGVVYPTFRSACRALGLLESDQQWDDCINKAALYRMPFMLRQLYATILLFSQPSNPYQLWLNHKDDLSEDYLLRVSETLNIQVSNLSAQQKEEAYNNSLLDINDFLEAQGSRLLAFEGFSISPNDTRRNISDPLAGLSREEARLVQLRIDAVNARDPSTLPFNAGQLHAFTTIMDACYDEERQRSVFFIDGPGGTGKTYLFNALLDAVRRNDEIALAAASSGTAALLLTGGKTAHSTFKIPLKIRDNTMCGIGQRSIEAEMIKDAKLIIWDEASMIRADVLSCVDRSLRDLMRVVDPVLEELPFGGKLFVFGGDFRQVLPVVPRGTRMDIVNQCINQMEFWNEVQTLPLTENMRVMQAMTSNNPELARVLQNFSNFLLSIGNGTAPIINDYHYTRIPTEMVLDNSTPAELTRQVYNNFAAPEDISPTALAGKAILATTNNDVDTINELLFASFNGEEVVYNSINTVIEQADALSFPVEFELCQQQQSSHS